jgi:hypothetical protein
VIDPELDDRLSRIEEAIRAFTARQAKEWYTPAEFAEAVGLAEFTVREHCRLERLNAQKKRSGRGAHGGWVIPHAERLRYEREGLLPDRRVRSKTASTA